MKWNNRKLFGKVFIFQIGTAIAEPQGAPDILYTIAIIEDAENRKILSIHPENIEFVSCPPEYELMNRALAGSAGTL
jgi:hypothetical protein